MRTGTFACWLWGHKFVIEHLIADKGDYYLIEHVHSGFCVRCGLINKQ